MLHPFLVDTEFAKDHVVEWLAQIRDANNAADSSAGKVFAK